MISDAGGRDSSSVSSSRGARQGSGTPPQERCEDKQCLRCKLSPANRIE
jgi:hypothetical protein